MRLKALTPAVIWAMYCLIKSLIYVFSRQYYILFKNILYNTSYYSTSYNNNVRAIVYTMCMSMPDHRAVYNARCGRLQLGLGRKPHAEVADKGRGRKTGVFCRHPLWTTPNRISQSSRIPISAFLIVHVSHPYTVTCHNRKLKTSDVLLESQVQGTSLFSSIAQKGSQKEV